MNLALLQAEARDTAKRLKTRLSTAIDANRDPTEEEEKENAKDEARLAELQPQIEKAQKMNSRLSAVPAFEVTAAPKVPAAPKAEGQNDGFRNLAEFALAVRQANPNAGSHQFLDPRLAAPTNVIMEGGDAAGSYLVPAEFRDEIISLVYETDDPILNLFAPKPTGKNRVQLIGSEVTPWGTSGVQAKWRSEGEQMSPSRTALTPREVVLNELYAFVLATEELLEDAPRVNDLLTREAAAAIRWKAGDAFVYGDGVGKPLGYINSPALVTVSKEASQTADTINAANIGKVYSRMINPQQAVWFANSDIMPQFMGLQSANGQLIWQSNYQDAPGGMLLGRPVYFTEHAKTVGDKGDLQFVNPNGYLAFKRQNGATFADSIHLYFDYNIRAFRWIFRVGGQPLLSAAVAPANGVTKSHFVVLEDRA